MTETEIQKKIVSVARGMGYKVYRMNAGTHRAKRGYLHLSESGTPDLLIIMPRGMALFCEVKRPGEDSSDIQRQRHKELRDLGHAVAVCRSVEDFMTAQDEVRNES